METLDHPVGLRRVVARADVLEVRLAAMKRQKASLLKAAPLSVTMRRRRALRVSRSTQSPARSAEQELLGAAIAYRRAATASRALVVPVTRAASATLVA